MLSQAETAVILTKIAACDQRTLGRTDVIAWTEILNLADPPIACEDALAAVAQWHADALDGRIRPAHVIQGAQAIARRRAGAAKAAELAERAELEAAETVDRTPEVVELVDQLARRMGTGDPTVLRRREWVAAERRRQRERDNPPVPNPQYDPRRAAEILRRNQDTA